MLILASVLVPNVLKNVEKAKVAEATLAARNIGTAAQEGVIEWNTNGKGGLNDYDTRRSLENVTLPFLESYGITRVNYDAYGNGVFTVLSTQNGDAWGNMLKKERGANRAVIYVNNPGYNQVMGNCYMTADGSHAVRIVYTPWGNGTYSKAGIFVEKGQ